jgi:hypothetical protein
MMPRLSAADIEWQTPLAEPRMSARAWRNLDRSVVREIAVLDRELSAWAGHKPKTEAVDRILDERLYRRSADAIATGPIIPGRSR